MEAVHNSQVSRGIAVFVTISLELLFAFLTGWTLFDKFLPWGLVPAIVVGALSGVTLFVLSLYVFIYREYAVDAIKIFSARRHENPQVRLMWAAFLVIVCIGIDSAANGDRMITLPALSGGSRIFIWIFFQLLIFVPFALGVLVHAHVNTTNPTVARQQNFVEAVDKALYSSILEVLPSLSPSELAALRRGDMEPLQAKLNAIEAEQKAITAPEAPDPLRKALGMLMSQSSQTAERNTGPQVTVK